MITLDTHALIWWLNGDKSLSGTALKAINNAMKSGCIYVSAISAWEIAMLIRADRLVMAMPLNEWIEKIEKLPFIKFVPVSNEIALDSVNLPGEFHKDPADRIIVSTARINNSTLITSDKKILSYPHVKTRW